MNCLKYSSHTYEILKAYTFLETSTPLRFDCGSLCSGRCCKGSQTDGMWLFPYEKELLENEKEFLITDCENNMGNPMLVCQGSCNRQRRPLACRMFPLFPYTIRNSNGDLLVKVMPDVRAMNYCPVADANIADKSFERSVRLAAHALIRNEEIAEYLVNLTKLLTYNPF